MTETTTTTTTLKLWIWTAGPSRKTIFAQRWFQQVWDWLTVVWKPRWHPPRLSLAMDPLHGLQKFGLQWQVAFNRPRWSDNVLIKLRQDSCQEAWSWCGARVGGGLDQGAPNLPLHPPLPRCSRPPPPQYQQVGDQWPHGLEYLDLFPRFCPPRLSCPLFTE